MHRIIFLRSTLIKYEISIAEFYIKKRAYLSSIKRCNFIIKNFYKNQNLYKTLKILILSYKKCNLFNLNNEIQIILKLNNLL